MRPPRPIVTTGAGMNSWLDAPDNPRPLDRLTMQVYETRRDQASWTATSTAASLPTAWSPKKETAPAAGEVCTSPLTGTRAETVAASPSEQQPQAQENICAAGTLPACRRANTYGLPSTAVVPAGLQKPSGPACTDDHFQSALLRLQESVRQAQAYAYQHMIGTVMPQTQPQPVHNAVAQAFASCSPAQCQPSLLSSDLPSSASTDPGVQLPSLAAAHLKSVKHPSLENPLDNTAALHEGDAHLTATLPLPRIGGCAAMPIVSSQSAGPAPIASSGSGPPMPFSAGHSVSPRAAGRQSATDCTGHGTGTQEPAVTIIIKQAHGSPARTQTQQTQQPAPATLEDIGDGGVLSHMRPSGQGLSGREPLPDSLKQQGALFTSDLWQSAQSLTRPEPGATVHGSANAYAELQMLQAAGQLSTSQVCQEALRTMASTDALVLAAKEIFAPGATRSSTPVSADADTEMAAVILGKKGRLISNEENLTGLLAEERRAMRRRITNRASAQRTREKRSETMDQVSQQLRVLKGENAALVKYVGKVEATCQLVTDELQKVKDRWSQTCIENVKRCEDVAALRNRLQAVTGESQGNILELSPELQLPSGVVPPSVHSTTAIVTLPKPMLSSIRSINLDEWLNDEAGPDE